MKYLLSLILLTIIHSISNLTAQDYYNGITLNSPQKNSRQINACGVIRLEPGFSFKAENNKTFSLKSGVCILGDALSSAFEVGTFSDNFEYSDTQNTANFTNQHTVRFPNDIYYKFTLNKKC